MEKYWIEPQRKAFTRWCNSHLINRNITLADLRNDLKNGINLIHLLEILTSESIKYNRSPRIEVQMMENLNKAIDFCKRIGLKLVNIGPEDIYHGNETLILGLIWQLIIKFKLRVQDSSGEGSKELLEWVKSVIPSYNIKNFTTDWQDGKAICALAEAVQSGQMNLPHDFKNDPIADCTMGVECAKNNMGIIALMDIEDIVRYPDAHSMITYISYFRDRAEFLKKQKNAINQENERLLDLTPDLSKCIVYGPALQQGNEAGQETYFTIEVRNSKNNIIPKGGHNIEVRITGPHSRSNFTAKDNNNGLYFVTFTPEEDGNYVIEVNLNKMAIGESPVHISVNPMQKPMGSKPKPHWYYQDLATKKWISYSDEDSDILEDQFHRFGGGSVNIREFKIDLSKREEVNTVKKHIIHHVSRPILRATWYWQDDDNLWVPYDESTSATLEKAIQSNEFNKNVNISDGKKFRYVTQFADGSFRQFRQSKEANAQGRAVQRGYNGQLILYELE